MQPRKQSLHIKQTTKEDVQAKFQANDTNKHSFTHDMGRGNNMSGADKPRVKEESSQSDRRDKEKQGNRKHTEQ